MPEWECDDLGLFPVYYATVLDELLQLWVTYNKDTELWAWEIRGYNLIIGSIIDCETPAQAQAVCTDELKKILKGGM